MTSHCFFWSAVMLFTLINIRISRERGTAPYRDRLVRVFHEWAYGNVFVLSALELSDVETTWYAAFCVLQILIYPVLCHFVFRKSQWSVRS